MSMGDMDVSAIRERLRALEIQAVDGKQDREELKDSISDLREAMDDAKNVAQKETSDIKSILHTIENELAKYRGFWGGILLVLSAVATAVGLIFKVWSKD
jgi:uncharacterized protein YukE